MGSDYWATFERVADTIYTRTKEECPREHELLTSMFSLYSSAFDALPQTGDGPAPIARVAILSQTLNTFWAMISLADTTAAGEKATEPKFPPQKGARPALPRQLVR